MFSWSKRSINKSRAETTFWNLAYAVKHTVTKHNILCSFIFGDHQYDMFERLHRVEVEVDFSILEFPEAFTLNPYRSLSIHPSWQFKFHYKRISLQSTSNFKHEFLLCSQLTFHVPNFQIQIHLCHREDDAWAIDWYNPDLHNLIWSIECFCHQWLLRFWKRWSMLASWVEP